MHQKDWVEPEVWYARLPCFYAATAALITDQHGRLLLVKPAYRNEWTFPGGYVDAGEFPNDACARELREELGVVAQVGDLLVVDWAPPAGSRPRALVSMTFDAGVLTDGSAVRLVDGELEDWEFVTATEAANRLPASTAPRVAAALGARATGRTVYLSGGISPS